MARPPLLGCVMLAVALLLHPAWGAAQQPQTTQRANVQISVGLSCVQGPWVVRVTVGNEGQDAAGVLLGSVHGTSGYLPDALAVEDGRGTIELNPAASLTGGVAEPWTVMLRPGRSFSFTLRATDFVQAVETFGRAQSYPLRAFFGDLRVRLIGQRPWRTGSRDDASGIPYESFWTGTARSNELPVANCPSELSARRGGGTVPRAIQ
jgi:hypothetical protein